MERKLLWTNHSTHLSLTGEKETLLMTIYAKAFENGSTHATVHDTKADKRAASIEYDFATFEGFALERKGTVLRAAFQDRY